MSKSDSEKLNDLFELVKGFREHAVRRLTEDEKWQQEKIQLLVCRNPFPAKDAINDFYQQALKIIAE